MIKWLRIAAVLLIAAVILSISVYFSGNFDFDKFDTRKFEPAEYICTEKVTSVRICDSDQDIMILPSDDGVCRLEYMQGEYDTYDISLKDGLLTVERSEKYNVRFFDFGPDRAIKLYLPEGEYESLYIDIASGDISVTKCSAAAVVLNSASGDISVKDSSAISISMDAASGDITVMNSTADNFDIGSASGDVDVVSVDAADGLYIDTASGDVDFRGVDAGSIYVSTASGDVYGSVTKPMMYETDTASGDVDVPVPMRDAGICRIETSSGDITIVEE